MIRQKTGPLVQEQEDNHLMYKAFCEKLDQAVEVCLANSFPHCFINLLQLNSCFFFLILQNMNENWKTGGCKKELKSKGHQSLLAVHNWVHFVHNSFSVLLNLYQQQHSYCNSQSDMVSKKWVVNQKREQPQIDVYDRWTHTHHSVSFIH